MSTETWRKKPRVFFSWNHLANSDAFTVDLTDHPCHRGRREVWSQASILRNTVQRIAQALRNAAGTTICMVASFNPSVWKEAKVQYIEGVQAQYIRLLKVQELVSLELTWKLTGSMAWKITPREGRIGGLCKRTIPHPKTLCFKEDPGTCFWSPSTTTTTFLALWPFTVTSLPHRQWRESCASLVSTKAVCRMSCYGVWAQTQNKHWEKQQNKHNQWFFHVFSPRPAPSWCYLLKKSPEAAGLSRGSIMFFPFFQNEPLWERVKTPTVP